MIQCPTCQTSYTAERLGIASLLERPGVVLSADVVCPICSTTFTARVEVVTKATPAPRTWRFWRREVMSSTETNIRTVVRDESVESE